MATRAVVGVLLGYLASHAGNVREVFVPGMGYSKCYRIPTIIQLRKSRTLLAFAEQRLTGCNDGGPHNLVLRRSVDSGATWGDVAESGRPGRPGLLAKKGRIVSGVGCPPNCRTSGKLRGNFGEARGSSEPFKRF